MLATGTKFTSYLCVFKIINDCLGRSIKWEVFRQSMRVIFNSNFLRLVLTMTTRQKCLTGLSFIYIL